MRAVILVPVKDFNRAKARLAPILAVPERARLAAAMLEDLMRALRPLRVPVALVTDSHAAAKLGSKVGWRIMWESRPVNESASVDKASRELAREGVKGILRLPADIPLASSADIRQILDLQLKVPSAVLVPSRDRMGTNAILRTPPDLFPSRFGHNSLVLHTQEAMRVQAQLEVLENPRIALDLDQVGDILRFVENVSDTATGRLLEKLKIRERLL